MLYPKTKKIFSEEHRKKLSLSHKGKLYSNKTRTKISIGNTGKHLSDETRQKMSLSHKNKKRKPFSPQHKQKISNAQKGNSNSFWKGGISTINNKIRNCPQYLFWRKAILQRDNFTCQKTEQKGGDLVAHHINNFADFPELRFAIDNGITLSKKAHKEFHKKYGTKNNTKEQLQEFLKIRD